MEDGIWLSTYLSGICIANASDYFELWAILKGEIGLGIARSLFLRTDHQHVELTPFTMNTNVDILHISRTLTCNVLRQHIIVDNSLVGVIYKLNVFVTKLWHFVLILIKIFARKVQKDMRGQNLMDNLALERKYEHFCNCFFSGERKN